MPKARPGRVLDDNGVASDARGVDDTDAKTEQGIPVSNLFGAPSDMSRGNAVICARNCEDDAPNGSILYPVNDGVGGSRVTNVMSCSMQMVDGRRGPKSNFSESLGKATTAGEDFENGGSRRRVTALAAGQIRSPTEKPFERQP